MSKRLEDDPELYVLDDAALRRVVMRKLGIDAQTYRMLCDRLNGEDTDMSDMSERNRKGQFTVGNPGGPGRLPRPTEAAYLRVVMQTCSPQAWAEIAARAVADAKKGDSTARAWLSKYLLGEPQAKTPTLVEAAVEGELIAEGQDPTEYRALIAKLEANK